MKVNVLFFASLKDAAGGAAEEVELMDGGSLAELKAALGGRYPKLAEWLPHVRVAVNQEYVTADQVLNEGDEVAFIPPVSGGQAAARLVRVGEDELSLDEVVRAVQGEGEFGAVCSFLGAVRRTSKDPDGVAHADIEFLDYEAYGPMAEKVLTEICEEAGQQWGAACAVTHRTGKLVVGEVSVAIAVATAHRAESFEACRYIIEELKKRVPIWKKETAESGHWWSEGSGA